MKIVTFLTDMSMADTNVFILYKTKWLISVRRNDKYNMKLKSTKPIEIVIDKLRL